MNTRRYQKGGYPIDQNIVKTFIKFINQFPCNDNLNYRLSANELELQKLLKNVHDKNFEKFLSKIIKKDNNVILAGLKSYLKQAENRIISTNAANDIIKIVETDEIDTKKEKETKNIKIAQIINTQINKRNRELLFIILKHLQHINIKEPNRVCTFQNLAIVFQPNLFEERPITADIFTFMGKEKNVLEYLIKNVDDIIAQSESLLNDSSTDNESEESSLSSLSSLSESEDETGLLNDKSMNYFEKEFNESQIYIKELKQDTNTDINVKLNALDKIRSKLSNMKSKVISVFSIKGGNKKRQRDDGSDEITEVLHEDEPAKKAARLIKNIDYLLSEIDELEEKLSEQYYKNGGSIKHKSKKHKYCRHCGRCKYCGKKW